VYWYICTPAPSRSGSTGTNRSVRRSVLSFATRQLSNGCSELTRSKYWLTKCTEQHRPGGCGASNPSPESGAPTEDQKRRCVARRCEGVWCQNNLNRIYGDLPGRVAHARGEREASAEANPKSWRFRGAPPSTPSGYVCTYGRHCKWTTYIRMLEEELAASPKYCSQSWNAPYEAFFKISHMLDAQDVMEDLQSIPSQPSHARAVTDIHSSSTRLLDRWCLCRC
jgi:hypothetical protein